MFSKPFIKHFLVCVLLSFALTALSQSVSELSEQLKIQNTVSSTSSIITARILIDQLKSQKIDKSIEAGAYYEIGKAFFNENLIDSASQFLDSAIAIGERLKEFEILCKSYFLISEIAVQNRNTEMLRRCNDRLMQAAVAIDNKEFICRAIWQKGIRLEYEAEFDSAFALYEISEKMAVEQGDMEFYFRQLIAKSATLTSLGRYSEALILLDNAQYFFSQTKNEAKLADVRLNMGVCLMRLGQFDAALNLYFKNLPYYSQKKHPGRYPSQLANIGLAYSKLDNYEKAKEFFLKAIENSENMASLECGVSLMLGTALVNMDSFEEAALYYKRGLLLAQANHFGRRVAESYYNFGALYLELYEHNRDLENRDSAEYYLGKAIKGYTQEGSRYGFIQTKILLADIYIDQQKLNTAEKDLLEVYDEILNSESKSTLPLVLLKLNELYRAKSDYQKADFYNVKYLAAMDELQKSELNDLLLEKEYYYKYLLKAKQDSLNHDNKLKIQRIQLSEKEQKLRAQTVYMAVVSVSLLAVVVLLIYSWRRNDQLRKARMLIGDQKNKVEQERNKLGVALENLKNTQVKLVEAERMAAIGSLTQTMAHEIINPLYFIKGSAKALRQICDQLEKNDRVPRLFEGMESGVKRISDIVQNLSKLDNKISKEQCCDSTEVVSKSVHNICKESPAGIDIIERIKGEYQVRISGDSLQLILESILRNAVEAISDSGTIEIWNKQVENRILLTVSDNGKGMTEEVAKKAVDPYFSTKSEVTGVGASLFTAYNLLKNVGGGLIINSEPGKGTKITVELELIQKAS